MTYRSISLYRPDWSLLIRYPEGLKDDMRSPSESYREKLQVPGELFVIGEDYRTFNNEVILPIGQGLLNRKGELGTYLVAEINLNRSLDNILGDTSDLDGGGRYLLVTKEGKILFQSEVAGQSVVPGDCTENMVPSQVLKSPAWEVRKKKNCKDVGIYSINAPVTEFQWLLIAQFDVGSESLQQSKNYVLYGLITVFCTLLILMVLAQDLSKRLAAPLNKLTKVARQISEGQHRERLPPFQEPYVQDLGEAFNSMIDALEKQQKSIIQSTTLSTIGQMSSSLVHEMRNPCAYPQS